MISVDTNRNPLCIYGDPAYHLCLHLQGHFRGAGLTPIQSAWNESMSKVRVSVEWIFGDVINSFKLLKLFRPWLGGLPHLLGVPHLHVNWSFFRACLHGGDHGQKIKRIYIQSYNPGVLS